MNVVVEHECTCGCRTCDSAGIESMDGVGLLRELTVEWTCIECGETYDQTHPFDLDLFEMSGFHSWVGRVDGRKTCIVVEDSEDRAGQTPSGGARKRGYIE